MPIAPRWTPAAYTETLQQPSRKAFTMTKADLTDRVAALSDITRRDSEVIVETLLESIVSALQSGDKVEVRGFGSFRTRQRNSRLGRNPKTGVSVAVPAKKVSYFKPSKELRELIGADVVDDDGEDDED